ncbi:MAG: metallophosphoesterase [Oscillospiraceae bacterium]|nr:metallophosphoesterase [Oscillospiraceae bacterium]
MRKRKKRTILWSVIAISMIAMILWIIWGNSALELTRHPIKSAKIPDAFDGYRIAHVSDLHNAEMGANNEDLLTMLREAEPDMIAITGDLIDSYHTDTQVALHFVQEAVKIAPCYYVTGNHEARVSDYPALKAAMEAAGAIVLEDERAQITLEGQTITLLGVDDPSFQTDYLSGDPDAVITDALTDLDTGDDSFTILLSHRPELFDVYVTHGIDLILSGHAHGGQFRLPFLGGLIAPGQGLFPEYDSGAYTEGSSTMIVSRGIGNSLFPFRVNNRPEVVLIELGCG